MIISQNDNDVYYAYTRGRFWRWDESAQAWKESHLLAQKFDKAKAAEKHLTPEAFLTGDEFIPMDDYELPDRMLTALRDAKPCKNAPIDPIEEDTSSGLPAPCICSTCTCGGCKEECFGNCHRCGHPVQECNSYQTEGEKYLTPAHSADVDEPEVPDTQTAQEKPLTTIPDKMRPAFDYSGLTDQTVEDLHFAEDEYRHGKQMAERGLVHMGNAIAAAHDALCGVVAQCDNGEDGACRTMRKARNNQHSEDTFKSWCVSIGITKDTAYRLLQVSALLDGSSPRQQKVLKELSPTLLYAVAKPSAPAELVEQVKSGDITTNKQYQEALAQLKAEKDRANAAEAREEEARKAAHEYHEKYKEAAAMRATLLDQQGAYISDVNGLMEQNAQLEKRVSQAEQECMDRGTECLQATARATKAEQRAKAAEDALKSQPITAVVDKDETRRQAEEMSRKAREQAARQVQEAQRAAAAVQAEFERFRQAADGFLAPEQVCTQQAQMIANAMRSMYLSWCGQAVAAGAPLAQMGAPLYALCGEIQTSLEEDTTINPTAAGSVEDAEREALFE